MATALAVVAIGALVGGLWLSSPKHRAKRRRVKRRFQRGRRRTKSVEISLDEDSLDADVSTRTPSDTSR